MRDTTTQLVGLVLLVATPIVVPVLFRLVGRSGGPLISPPSPTRTRAIRAAADGRRIPWLAIILVAAFGAAIAFGWGQSPRVWLNIVDHASILAILAVSMTVAMRTGGVDLSVGAVLGLSGILFALLLNQGSPLLAAVAVTLVAAAVVGLVNGWLIARQGLPAFAVTLATLAVVQGMATVLSSHGIETLFIASRFRGSLMPPLPNTTLVLVGVVAAAAQLDKGATGALRGLGAYVFSSAAASVAGIFLVMSVGAAIPTIGLGMEVQALAAALVGGVGFAASGRIVGAIVGAVIGALAVELGRTAFLIAAFPPSLIGVMAGALLLLGLVYHRIRQGRW